MIPAGLEPVTRPLLQAANSSPQGPPLTTPQSRITSVFQRQQSSGRMAFMPFITAGDPDLAFTQQLILKLAEQGVDLIEVGFPYSDPIADGPVIQASYTRALQNKLQVNQIFTAVESINWNALEIGNRPALVAMVSYAIVFRMGVSAFCKRAQAAGFSGLIIPDLPADEAAETAATAAQAGLDVIQLIAPTTTVVRTKKILDTATGFLYCISVAGTTGVREALPEELTKQLSWLKTQTKLPLAVGFGISRPDQVAPLRGLADGVIVGSAIVKEVARVSEANEDRRVVLERIAQSARAMVAACAAQ